LQRRPGGGRHRARADPLTRTGAGCYPACAHVDSRGDEHLKGQLSLAGGVGEAVHAVAAHALGERQHLLFARVLLLATWAALGCGRIPRHALRAAWAWGERPAEAGTAIRTDCSPGWLEETFGSGKFGTPCWRMHCENLNAAAAGLLAGEELLVVGEEEPHAASSAILAMAVLPAPMWAR
jgi:hypothetical protein